MGVEQIEGAAEGGWGGRRLGMGWREGGDGVRVGQREGGRVRFTSLS